MHSSISPIADICTLFSGNLHFKMSSVNVQAGVVSRDRDNTGENVTEGYVDGNGTYRRTIIHV